MPVSQAAQDLAALETIALRKIHDEDGELAFDQTACHLMHNVCELVRHVFGERRLCQMLIEVEQEYL